MSLTNQMESLVMDIENSTRSRKEYVDCLKKHMDNILNNNKNQRSINSRVAQDLRAKQISELKTDVKGLIEKFHGLRENMSAGTQQKLETFTTGLSADVNALLDSYKKGMDIVRKERNDVKEIWKKKSMVEAAKGESDIGSINDNTGSQNDMFRAKILEFIKKADDGRKLSELTAMKDLPSGTDIADILSGLAENGLIKRNKFKYYAR